MLALRDRPKPSAFCAICIVVKEYDLSTAMNADLKVCQRGIGGQTSQSLSQCPTLCRPFVAFLYILFYASVCTCVSFSINLSLSPILGICVSFSLLLWYSVLLLDLSLCLFLSLLVYLAVARVFDLVVSTIVLLRRLVSLRTRTKRMLSFHSLSSKDCH